MTQDRRFQTILRVDAAVCLACGLPGLVAPAWLASFLLPAQPGLFGLPLPTVMQVLGILLAAYAGLLLFISTRQAVPRIVVAVTALADVLWVLGTAALLVALAASFSLWGTVALAIVALDTGLIGLWKLQALRRQQAAFAAA